MKGKFNLELMTLGIVLISCFEMMMWNNINPNNTLTNIEKEKIGLNRKR